jgi:hypothetical protein
MCEVDAINQGPGVCTREYETELLDVSVSHVNAGGAALLDKTIREDREAVDVTVNYQLASRLSCRRVVEVGTGVNTLGTILEERMSENILRTVILVLPDERNFLPVLMLEGTIPKNSTVRAQQIVLGCPSTKVRYFHFEDLLSC